MLLLLLGGLLALAQLVFSGLDLRLPLGLRGRRPLAASSP